MNDRSRKSLRRSASPDAARWASSAALLLALAATVAISRTPCAADEAFDRVVAEQSRRIEVIARARAATVAIFSRDGRGGGSGVLLTPDGFCVTNYHVVKPCGPFMKCGLDDGRIYDAVIVGIDATGDVALVRLLGRDDFPTAPLADSDQVRIGDSCFAIGNPFLLATNLQPTVTWGIVSGTRRYQYPAGTLLEYTDCLQTDASINPGNSGGPLFDAEGNVIGINGRISLEKRARVNVGVGYAISANQVRHFYGVLSSGRLVDHATLGATVETDREGRVAVDAILEGTDAFRRGLRYGHQIVSFGGRSIDTVNGFKNVLGIFPDGWRVPIAFDTSDGRIETRVRLERLHGEEELIELVQGPATAPSRPDGEEGPDGEGPSPDEGDPHGSDSAAEAEVSPSVAAWYEPRRGFANFFFNRVHQDRLLAPYSDRSRAEQLLQVTLETADGGTILVAVGPGTAAWRAGNDVEGVDFGQDLATQLAPSNTGLLLAIHHWQRLIVGELRRTGEVIYLGTGPGIDDTSFELAATHDRLAATLGSVESEFVFETGTGRLAGIELLADDRFDPCRLIFSDETEFDGMRLPSRWRVVVGETTVGDFRVVGYRWSEVPPAGERGNP